MIHGKSDLGLIRTDDSVTDVSFEKAKKPMRILALPRYESLGASSRLRSFQYIPILESMGFAVDVEPLFGNDYVRGLYAGRVPWLSVVRSYLRRIWCLMRSRQYDALLIEKELLPWLPAFIESAMVPRSVAVVIDYDDAIFHNYDMHYSRLVRAVLGRKIDNVMRRADLVTAGNAYLVARANAAGCPKVELVPTVIDLERYPLASEPKDDEMIVGWIGSPATAGYLQLITAVAEQLRATHRVRFVAIGARPDQVHGTPFEAWEWRESTEAAQLRRLDIGIMPLADEPWERGKCGYKLIQYMACGLPVVASPVGINSEIVQHGENGFLAADTAAWLENLTGLIEDPSLRLRLGDAGRRRVEEKYCLHVQGPRLAGLFTQLQAH